MTKHKRIGILGGMSPESTIEYYQYITRRYTAQFGDYDYPEVLIYSVSFQSYVDWPEQDRWDLVAQGLSRAGLSLQAAGADFLVIATNTMHLVVDQVRDAVDIPVLSICEMSTLVKVSNPPLSMLVRVYSLNVRIKTKEQEEKMPARIWGNSMSQKACHAVAPQFLAASVC